MRTYGNLATAPQTKPQVKPKTKSVKTVRKKGLPAKEKLLYLGTIIVFVLVTSWVIANDATLSKLHYDRQQLEQNTTQLVHDNAELEREIKTLTSPDRIRQFAVEQGMTRDLERIKPLPSSVSSTPKTAVLNP